MFKDIFNKENLLKNSLLISLLSTMLLAYPLWLSERTIPSVALFPFFENLPKLVHYSALYVLVLCLLLAFMNKDLLPKLLVAVCCFAILVFEDINRLQPYYYLYFLLMLFIAFAPQQKERNINALLSVMLAGIYFHSGLSKWNDNFTSYLFPNMLYVFHYFSIEEWQTVSYKNIAYFIPLGEMFLGLLWLLPKTKKWASKGALILHAGILIAIGPFGLNWNKIVWIWNIFMLVLNIIVYYQSTDSNTKAYKSWLWLPAISLFLLLPFLSYWGKWDQYLSFSLYSGKTPNVQIYVSQQNGLEQIPLLYTNSNDTFIDLNVWSLHEMNTAIYAESWVFEAVSQQVCESITCDSLVNFEVYKESVNYVGMP